MRFKWLELILKRNFLLTFLPLSINHSIMQENNNFETIISTWRRMSGEQTESVPVSMSGDSSELHKKKEEEATLVLPERLKGPIAGAVAIAEVLPEKEEKLKKREISDSKEAAGDANSEDENYLENKDSLASSPDEKKVLSTDKVDSVFVIPGSKIPPQSTASTPEEEDCVIKCLYYTLQCCDCVIM